jgi:Mce-associated membrane protein
MTGDVRRNRGPGRPGAPGRRPPVTGADVQRRRARVAGQRAAERRQQLTQPVETRPRRGLTRPSPTLPRLPRPRRPHLSGVAAVLAVLVLLAAVAVGYLAVQLRNARASESAAANGQVLAARYAEQLLSYHHARLDQDFAQAQELLTDDFLPEYREATDVVRDQAVADRAVIEASVVASSVVSAEPDEVKTLLFVNQTTTTGEGGNPSLDLNRVMLTLVEEDGRWLVSDLDAL